jgi:hypothetical protein
MGSLTIEFPTSPDDWSGLVGRDLDAKLRELEVVARRAEADSSPPQCWVGFVRSSSTGPG